MLYRDRTIQTSINGKRVGVPMNSFDRQVQRLGSAAPETSSISSGLSIVGKIIGQGSLTIFGHGTARKSLTYLIEPVASSTEITFQMTGRAESKRARAHTFLWSGNAPKEHCSDI